MTFGSVFRVPHLARLRVTSWSRHAISWGRLSRELSLRCSCSTSTHIFTSVTGISCSPASSFFSTQRLFHRSCVRPPRLNSKVFILWALAASFSSFISATLDSILDPISDGSFDSLLANRASSFLHKPCRKLDSLAMAKVPRFFIAGSPPGIHRCSPSRADGRLLGVKRRQACTRCPTLVPFVVSGIRSLIDPLVICPTTDSRGGSPPLGRA
mmetsp:Transcript_17724/g.28271  ORF Transcript_17724/g.28271 Transcript_17724/m.28271 type:complete len:212 (+) Transcript_17724:1235-1870(+)